MEFTEVSMIKKKVKKIVMKKTEDDIDMMVNEILSTEDDFSENEEDEMENEIISNYKKNQKYFSKYFHEIQNIYEIEKDNQRLFTTYFDKEPSSSYLGGFIDGDGSIAMNKSNADDEGYTSSIRISQCRTNILQIIQYHFGGSIGKDERYGVYNEKDKDGIFEKLNRRMVYDYCCRGINKKYLVDHLKKGIILKEENIDILLENRKYENKSGFHTERTHLYEKMKILNSKIVVPRYNFMKINEEYIAGLFDAEGYCYMAKSSKTEKYTRSVYMKITQKNHPQIIEEILKFIGFGKVDSGGFIYVVQGAEECIRFIHIIESHLIVKLNEVKILKNYIETMKYTAVNGYDDKIHDYRKYLSFLMSREKHENEIYEPENNIEEFKGFQKKIQDEKEKEELEREERRKEAYRQKSENMKGEKNHNFGKKMKDEVKEKSSVTNRLRLMQISPIYSDENIRYMFNKMHNEGMSIMEVVEHMVEYCGHKPDRNIVAKIYTGARKPIELTPEEELMYEEMDKKIKYNEKMKEILTKNQYEKFVKRSLTFEQILEVIQWKNYKSDLEKKKKLCQFLNEDKVKNVYSKEVRTNYLKSIGIPTTIDVTTNIFLGKTMLFEEEFKFKEEQGVILSMNYEEYTTIVNSKE